MHFGETFLTEEELKSIGFKKLGKNVLIKKNVGIFFTENLSIGDNVRIDDFTIIVASAPCEIGSYIHIASHCYLAGSAGIIFEDFTALAPGGMIFTGSVDFSGKGLTNPTVGEKYMIETKSGMVILKKHAVIGAGTVVFPGCVLGEGASVGAMSLVTKSLEPWGVYAGIPVRRIRERKKDLLALEKELLEND